MPLLLDLKGHTDDGELVRQSVELVVAGGHMSRCTFASFNENHLMDLLASETSQRIKLKKAMITANMLRDHHCSYITKYDLCAIVSEDVMVSADLCKDVHSLGCEVFAYTVNSRGSFYDMDLKGVDGVITNFPHLMQRREPRDLEVRRKLLTNEQRFSSDNLKSLAEKSLTSMEINDRAVTTVVDDAFPPGSVFEKGRARAKTDQPPKNKVKNLEKKLNWVPPSWLTPSFTSFLVDNAVFDYSKPPDDAVNRFSSAMVLDDEPMPTLRSVQVIICPSAPHQVFHILCLMCHIFLPTECSTGPRLNPQS
jgi:hypothetical protein